MKNSPPNRRRKNTTSMTSRKTASPARAATALLRTARRFARTAAIPSRTRRRAARGPHSRSSRACPTPSTLPRRTASSAPNAAGVTPLRGAFAPIADTVCMKTRTFSWGFRPQTPILKALPVGSAFFYNSSSLKLSNTCPSSSRRLARSACVRRFCALLKARSPYLSSPSTG